MAALGAVSKAQFVPSEHMDKPKPAAAALAMYRARMWEMREASAAQSHRTPSSKPNAAVTEVIPSMSSRDGSRASAAEEAVELFPNEGQFPRLPF